MNTPLPAARNAVASEIFKAYDIRGVIGTSLTEATAELIGRALGSEAHDRGVTGIAVGRDGRLSGPALVAALTRGINASGVDVIDIGQVPTPVAYFAANTLTHGSAVSVTGSHNPPDYNGFKMMLAGETLSGDTIQALRERIESSRFTSGTGARTQADVREAYLARITSDVRLARPLKILVDCGNGVAGELAPELYRRMGCQVTEMYCEIDGHFPNHHPDPSKPENVAELIERVRQGGYDLGFAFDGDGDRLGVVAPDGAIIWPDRQMVLFARDVLSRNPGGTIIYDVKCSRTLPVEIEAAGGQAMIWKTGHSLIKARLKETGALLAGEMSGHIFFKERWYGFDDGLYAGARLLELLSRDARPIGEILNGLPNTVNTPELNIKFPEGEHHVVIRELIAAAHFPDGRFTTIDGLRVDFPDGFGLVRASNTTSVLVLRFEGDTVDALERIQHRFRALLHTVRPGLALPF